MYKVLDVEKYIYNYCHIKDINDLSHKKLQTLLYYLQSWFLVKTEGKPLFEDEIEAWMHGPVISDSYHRYKHHSFNPIDIDMVKYKECKFIKDHR